MLNFFKESGGGNQNVNKKKLNNLRFANDIVLYQRKQWRGETYDERATQGRFTSRPKDE